MRFQFFGSCLLAIQKASSWSLFAHAHFILGRPVECLSIWPSSCDFWFFSSYPFAIWRASSWSFFCACPFLSRGIWWGAYLPGLHHATFFCHFFYFGRFLGLSSD